MCVGCLRVAPQSAELGSVFAQLNSACASDVMAVIVEAGMQCHTPLHVLVLSSPAVDAATATASHPRLLLAAGAGSSIEVTLTLAPPAT
eukprot:1188197-Prorocentrum_minimum.AAC.8